MPESPVSIILQMVNFLIETTIRTFQGIFSLFGNLLESLGVVSEVGGPLGFGVSVVVIGVVGFFIAKILFGAGKKLILLVLIGIILVYILILGSIV